MGKFISQKVGHEGWSRAGMGWAKQKSEDEENRGNMVETGERERERKELATRMGKQRNAELKWKRREKRNGEGGRVVGLEERN